MRVPGLVGLWFFCLVLALSGGWTAVWTIVYALGILLVGGFLWARLSVRGVELRRRHRPHRVSVGDTLHEQAILELTPGLSHWWPRLWLEVHDGSDLPGHKLSRVVSLGFLGRRVWETQSTLTRRGRFTLGPVWVMTGDPFGLFRASRQVGGESTLIVYPRTVPLPRAMRLPGELPGGSLQGSRSHSTTPNVSTIRDYAPGDPFNRIHWRTTARMNRLMVREFELDPSADIWVVLDLHAAVQVGQPPSSTEEVAVSAAASLARHYLEMGRAVGLVSQAATLPADRGPRQMDRLLEVLALARASSHLSLEALVTAELPRFARASTLLVVTPTTSEGWVHLCHSLRARGVHTVGVVVEAATFGAAPSPILLIGQLAAARVSTYLVKNGQPLDQALAMPTGMMGRA